MTSVHSVTSVGLFTPPFQAGVFIYCIYTGYSHPSNIHSSKSWGPPAAAWQFPNSPHRSNSVKPRYVKMDSWDRSTSPSRGSSTRVFLPHAQAPHTTDRKHDFGSPLLEFHFELLLFCQIAAVGPVNHSLVLKTIDLSWYVIQIRRKIKS